MKKSLLERMKCQKGIAMVTVLLVGAGLTVVASTATFVTIREFRAGLDDRRGAEAVAFAESGLDRMLLELFNHDWTDVNEAGCALPPISVPEGELGDARFFNSYFTVFDPALAEGDRLPDLGTWNPGDTWNAAANDSKAVCMSHNNKLRFEPRWFAITSTGEHPTATRVVRQAVKISALGLPIGLFAESVNVQGGNPSTLDISMVTSGSVEGREKLEFTGYDPYYKLGDFWAGESMDVKAPSAVHALGSINCAKSNCGNDKVEHPALLECGANRANNGQSQWDQSSGGGSLIGFAKCPLWAGSPAAPPPYSSFNAEDLKRATPTPKLDDQILAKLKAAAQASGMYCLMGSNGTGSCTTPTTTFNTNGTFQNLPAGVGNKFIAYFDFPTTGDPFAVKSTITWKAPVGPCSFDKNLHKSAMIVIRYGSLDLTGKDEIVGAFFAPEGQVWLRGSGGIVKIHGTTIAKKIDIGGNAEVKLSDCWVSNMPGPFLGVTPLQWSEVDR